MTRNEIIAAILNHPNTKNGASRITVTVKGARHAS